MRIVSLTLKNFRCFSSVTIDFESPVVLIYGPNGSGKTSIIEALHYGCYLRSFKTHLPREIASTSADNFGIALGIAHTHTLDTLHIQVSRTKKNVRLNQQPIGSYKELNDVYKVVTITEDDLLMVQGAPALRRSFIDHMVMLIDAEYAPLLKRYRTILENRNSLLASNRDDEESYHLWTDQLLTASARIQKARISVLEELERETQLLLAECNEFFREGAADTSPRLRRPDGGSDPFSKSFREGLGGNGPVNAAAPEEAGNDISTCIQRPMQESSLTISEGEAGKSPADCALIYEYSRSYKESAQCLNSKDLLDRYPGLRAHELAQKRSLFGAHLDDFTLFFQGKACRTYASRGQQKFLIFLLKLAHVRLLRGKEQAQGVILLVDDFMTDFDEERSQALLTLMTTLPTQLILTTPLKGVLQEKLRPYAVQYIDISTLYYTDKQNILQSEQPLI